MRVMVRVDASLDIGTGHVMRCLTLADRLRERGAAVHFICREHVGHLQCAISSAGFSITLLPKPTDGQSVESNDVSHGRWRGVSQAQDAADTIAALPAIGTDWFIIDHYGLDHRYQMQLRPHCRALMVIDDIADRLHDCDLLLDQNLGRKPSDYVALVPPSCKVLAGPHYALLRPEFAAWREISLARRKTAGFSRLLINLGGVDRDNVTTRVLDALKPLALPKHLEIDVVMGSTSPALADVSNRVVTMPWRTQLHVGVSNMAEMMAKADLAIGAAGTTSWERCCLGLPTLVLVLADNQRLLAEELQNSGAAYFLDVSTLGNAMKNVFTDSGFRENFLAMSIVASEITDGNGTAKVVQAIEAY